MSLVSIIIPVYNTGKYLYQCLDSVLNQTYKEIEIIVIDDHSTDPLTLEILNHYKEKYPNIKFSRNEVNSGLSISRNKGISLANGDFFTFLDSDDYLLPDFVETMLNAINNFNVSYVICNYVDFHETEQGEKDVKVNNCNIKPNIVYQLQDLFTDLKIFNLNVSAYARLIPLKSYKESQNKFVEGSLFEDNDWNIRLAINSKSFVYLDYGGYRRRIHSASIIHSTTNSKINDMIFVCYRMYESLKKINKIDQNRDPFFIFYMNSCLGKLDWFEKKEDRDQYIKLYSEYLTKMGYTLDNISKTNCKKFKLLYKIFKLIGNDNLKKLYKAKYIQQKFLLKYQD